MMTEEKRKEIGQRLRLFREMLGKSRQEMAEEINTSEDILYRIEEGTLVTVSYHEDLFQLYFSYGCNSTWLLEGLENIFSFKGPNTPEDRYLVIVILYNGNPDPMKLGQLVEFIKHEQVCNELIAQAVELKAHFSQFKENGKKQEKKKPFWISKGSTGTGYVNEYDHGI
jgi:transcriptional regulator with XRE-family HTH domain